jgi:hypothetical protein
MSPISEMLSDVHHPLKESVAVSRICQTLGALSKVGDVNFQISLRPGRNRAACTIHGYAIIPGIEGKSERLVSIPTRHQFLV